MEAMLGRVVDEADARQLPVLIAEWLATDDVRRWIARALRIDLPVLAEHPELTVPCLLRRCAAFGREGNHFKLRPQPPGDAGGLRALAAQWRDQFTRPHLASLRPTAVPLDGAVIEEYRTGLEGELVATVDTIGISGAAGAIAWERASGRRIALPPSELGSDPWQIDRSASGGGRVVLIGPRGPVELAIGLDESAWNVIGLDANRVLLPSRIDDPYGQGDDTDYLRLVEGGTIMWRADGHASGACLFGDTILCRGFKSALFALELATGALARRWPLPIYPSHHAAIGRDVFVTRDAHVIRVWDATRTPWPELDLESPGVGAEWSPDGTRLRTGHGISDARTGAQLCVLQLHGLGEWLEGGPPAGCRRLCNGVFVEQTPFGLYVWDSTTGQIVVEDQRRGASIGDAVAFDPSGRYHAHWPGRSRDRESANPLRIRTLRGGEVLFDRSVTLARRMAYVSYELGFSPDGERLWWIDREGGRWTFEIAGAHVRRLADDEPLPLEPREQRAELRDGLVHLRDLALPCDDEHVLLAHDGRSACGGTAHVALANS